MIYSCEAALESREIKCGIYKIINLITNKFYIGQSVDIFRRWRDHVNRVKNNKPVHNSLIEKSMIKYGVEKFSLEIVELCAKEELNQKEYFWAEQLNSYVPNGYNVALCGGAMVNEARMKSVSSYNMDTCELINTYPSTRAAERATGVDHSQISACCRQKTEYFSACGYFWAYGNAPSINKPPMPKKWTTRIGKTAIVYQYDLKTRKLLNSYSSCAKAAEALQKKYKTSICKAANGQAATAHGFAWSYKCWDFLPYEYQLLNLQLSRGELFANEN